jgi:hypothetical protein
MSISLDINKPLDLQQIAEAASGTVGQLVAFEPISGGRNSQVYRASRADGRSYALKVYPRGASDPRDRLGTEYNSLTFLWQHGVRQIPEPITADRALGFALYSFIDGRPVPIDEVTEPDIDTLIDFLVDLRELVQLEESLRLPPASEAFFNVQEIVENLHARLSRLGNARPDEPLLDAFLDAELIPALNYFKAWGRELLGDDWARPLPVEQRILSPSDFGFHNTLRPVGGKLVFVDFEYFGWDDPAKTMSDFLLHPAMPLSLALRRHFVTGVLAHLEPVACERLRTLYPLFGIKWCFICLNEFLPVYQHRRAAMSAEAWEKVKSLQLSKARGILKRITSEHEHFPYR